MGRLTGLTPLTPPSSTGTSSFLHFSVSFRIVPDKGLSDWRQLEEPMRGAHQARYHILKPRLCIAPRGRETS